MDVVASMTRQQNLIRYPIPFSLTYCHPPTHLSSGVLGWRDEAGPGRGNDPDAICSCTLTYWTLIKLHCIPVSFAIRSSKF